MKSIICYDRAMVISGKTRIFAIIGRPVDHSLSPAIHNAAFAEIGLDAVFVAFPSEEAVEAVRGARALGMAGLAVTAPFKMDAFDLCDEVDRNASTTEAVNTLRFGDRVEGFNTDVDGIQGALAESGRNFTNANAVVVGAGGTARATLAALANMGIRMVGVLARDNGKAEQMIGPVAGRLNLNARFYRLGTHETHRSIEFADLIVNTTPVGLNDDSTPFDAHLLHQGQTILDVVYRKGGTPLFIAAEESGCKAIGGERMLLKQAFKQFEIFTGRQAPEKAMEKALNQAIGK